MNIFIDKVYLTLIVFVLAASTLALADTCALLCFRFGTPKMRFDFLIVLGNNLSRAIIFGLSAKSVCKSSISAKSCDLDLPP